MAGSAHALVDEGKCWLEHILCGSGDVAYRVQSIPGQGLFLSPALHNADAFVLRTAEPSEEALQLTCMELSSIAARCAKRTHLHDHAALAEIHSLLSTVMNLCKDKRSEDRGPVDKESDAFAASSSVELGFDICHELEVFQNIARESGLLASLFNLAFRGRAQSKAHTAKHKIHSGDVFFGGLGLGAGGVHRGPLEATQDRMFCALEKLVRGCRPSQAYFVRKEFFSDAEHDSSNNNQRSGGGGGTGRSLGGGYKRSARLTASGGGGTGGMSSSSSSSSSGGGGRSARSDTQRRWIDFVLQQAGHFPGAAILLNALIENNEELLIQEKYGRYVNQEVVNELINLIRWQGPQPRFLEFFRHICTCKGEKIVPNQELLVNHLYLKASNRRELFIETTTPIKISDELITWPAAPTAAAAAAGEGRHARRLKVPKAFFGRTFYEKGFRPVYVKWFSSENWRPNQNALFHSPRALHLVDKYGTFYERDVWLQRVAWVLDPAKLFKKVMFEGLNILKRVASRKSSRTSGLSTSSSSVGGGDPPSKSPPTSRSSGGARRRRRSPCGRTSTRARSSGGTSPTCRRF